MKKKIDLYIRSYVRRKAVRGGRGHRYLSQEVGRKVLMDAQSSSLLSNAGESDGGRDLELLSDV